MKTTKLIALDLDGTLLNSRKELSPVNAGALARAASHGVEIVPATGRFFLGMPESVRELPFINYSITINGASVYDIHRDKIICRSEMSSETSVSVMEFLDSYDVIYDCYKDNWGYMTASMRDKVDIYLHNPYFAEMVLRLRKPVPELKAYLREHGGGVQKTQFFTPDPELKAQLMRELKARFPELSITSSVAEDVEINAHTATKGEALRKLAEYLGISLDETAAFGDGLNDVPMILSAGTGFAMGNACPEALSAADIVVSRCDEDGVAEGIGMLGF